MFHWSKSKRVQKRGTHVEIYEANQEREMKREIKKASRNGWIVASMTSTEGHVNIGRAAMQVVLFSPLSLIFGTSRTKGKITVNYRYSS